MRDETLITRRILKIRVHGHTKCTINWKMDEIYCVNKVNIEMIDD